MQDLHGNQFQGEAMKMIVKDRAMGKTTQLVYISAFTGYPIVVPCEAMIVPTKEIAKKLGCNIPEPVTALAQN